MDSPKLNPPVSQHYLSSADFLKIPWVVTSTTCDLVRAYTYSPSATGRVAGLSGKTTVTKIVPGNKLLVVFSWYMDTDDMTCLDNITFLAIEPSRLLVSAEGETLGTFGDLLKNNWQRYLFHDLSVEDLVGSVKLF